MDNPDTSNTTTNSKKNWFVRHKVWTALIALFIIAALASSGDKSKTSTTTSKSSAQATHQKAATPAKSTEAKVPAEYKSALYQANTYANSMHMSKQGVYDQLVSQYGGKFTPEAAQYAIDNVKSDWNKNALAKAKDYQNTMHLSPAEIHDQLTSDAGEKFTQTEADYAIQHLND
jgi:hypothetical protein